MTLKLVALSFFFSFSIPQGTSQEWTIELDSILTFLAQEGIFNGQLLLEEGNMIRFEGGYGTYEEKPITSTTALPIASIDKTLTALGIIILKERNLLDYDDLVVEYIPGLPYDKVSIRHLLNQTSGLPRFLSTAIEHGDTSKVMKSKEIIELISHTKPEGGKTGEAFTYNNSNYFLCRIIIEAVTNMSYEDFMFKNVFSPLEMEHTRVQMVSDQLNNSVIGLDNFYQSGGEMYSSAYDLFQFSKTYRNAGLIGDESIKEAFTGPQLSDGEKSNYGFGWYLLEEDNEQSVGHWGRGEAVKSYLEIYLTKERSLILLSVNSTSYIDKIYQMIRDIWEGRPYELPVKNTVYDIDPRLYDEYVGSYLTPNMGLLHISTEGGKLFLRPDPIPGKEELVPLSDSTFTFRNQDLQWQFFRSGDGNVQGFGFSGDKEKMGPKQE